MNISYRSSEKIDAKTFIDILERSSLGERRPIENLACMEGMLANADILVLAFDGEKIVGVARAVSDFDYACYLSDLAVDRDYQKMGIGKRLIERVKEELEEGCKIILLSAPDAREYYPHIGFSGHDSAWVFS